MRNGISQRTVHILVASLLVAAPLLLPKKAYAGPLTNRSVQVSVPEPDAITSHTFNFTIPSVSSIGSIQFEYCTNDPFTGSACTTPVGLSVIGATIGNQTGETGFTIDPSTTANKLIISRAPGMTAAIPVSYRFDNVTNHSTVNQSVYVRIATFASADGTGPWTDDGAVVYTISRKLDVTGYVPPYLTFCAAVNVAPNCSSVTGSFLSFGELSPTQTRFVSSQFAVATNDVSGYSTTVTGSTMTSGSYTIAGMDSPAFSQVGTPQFGMNLRANSNPAIGNEPTGLGSGVISPDFAQSNRFKFGNQVMVSSSKSTEFNVFTVSYIVNVPPEQHPGIYSTTITYIASAAF